MQESARAALTCVWSCRDELGFSVERIRDFGAHVHVPAGSVPKDGPSAGVTVATALASLYTGLAVEPTTAMTGEITLSGLVLSVGGIKEKLLAARRAGLRRIVLPAGNAKDLPEIDACVLRDLEILFAERVEDAWALAIPGLGARLGKTEAKNGGRGVSAVATLSALTGEAGSPLT